MASDNGTTPQRPIGSGFDATSTTADVIAGIDLTGRLAVVTGGYSGIGLPTTRALLDAGAHVVVPARRPEVAAENLPAGVETAELDLADLGSVRAFADAFLAGERKIDLLVASAGIMACPETRVGDNWELQFATNHLGHFALVNRLRPALAAGDGARVVMVSSAGHHRSPIRWDDVHFTTGYEPRVAYGQSKTANALFARHLDTLGRDDGIRAFSLHPGAILTPLQRHMTQQQKQDAGWIDEHGNLIDPRFKSPEQGAATQVWAATSPRLAGLGGVYCEDCDIAEEHTIDDLGQVPAGMKHGVNPYATDPEQAARLWAYSVELTGVGG